MTPSHKSIRRILRKASRTEYEKLVREAKLSPQEESCLDQFILHNKTQYQIAAQFNFSERTVRLYLCHAYNKIADCHLLAVRLPTCEAKTCYAIGVGGMQNVWNESIPAGRDNEAAAVFRAVAIGW